MDNPGTTSVIPADARLFGKMAKIMGIVNRVPKSGTNTFHNYKYASADDVADTIRGAMSEVNLALIVRMGEVKQERIEYQSSSKTTSTMRTTINFDFIFACGDTGAVISAPWTSQVDDNSDKAINKCATSAEKYFLMKTFIVSAGDEPDSDADKHTDSTPRKVTPPATTEEPWSYDIRVLEELANRSHIAGFIEHNGATGIREMLELIAPATWTDFTNRNAAALAVKEASERVNRNRLIDGKVNGVPVEPEAQPDTPPAPRSGSVNVTEAVIEDRTVVFTTKEVTLKVLIKRLIDMLQPNGVDPHNKSDVRQRRWLESVKPGLWQDGASVTFPELRLSFQTLREQNNALTITSIDVAADMPQNGAASDATFPPAAAEYETLANDERASEQHACPETNECHTGEFRQRLQPVAGASDDNPDEHHAG